MIRNKNGSIAIIIAVFLGGLLVGGGGVTVWARQQSVKHDKLQRAVEQETSAKLSQLQDDYNKKKEAEALEAAELAAIEAAKAAEAEATAKAEAEAAAKKAAEQQTATKKTETPTYTKKPFVSFSLNADSGTIVVEALLGGTYSGKCTLSLKHIATGTYKSEVWNSDLDGCRSGSVTTASLGQTGEWKGSVSFYSNDGLNKFYSDSKIFTVN